jgi:hypothetical protein
VPHIQLSRTRGSIWRRFGVTFLTGVEGAVHGPTTSLDPLAKV